ncbi:hypothetical protein HYU11_00140 [Candidatus Woesearchaeota archaeon]|nr:hypothetical protein [Candidatus Woesearchaeota archaeon]
MSKLHDYIILAAALVSSVFYRNDHVPNPNTLNFQGTEKPRIIKVSGNIDDVLTGPDGTTVRIFDDRRGLFTIMYNTMEEEIPCGSWGFTLYDTGAYHAASHLEITPPKGGPNYSQAYLMFLKQNGLEPPCSRK